jgi:hypothetical protein
MKAPFNFETLAENIVNVAMFITMSISNRPCFPGFFCANKFALILFFATLASAPANAQSLIDGSMNAGAAIPNSQIAQIAFPSLDTMFNPDLLAVFVLDCIIVLAVSSAIVFHPVRIRARRNVRDLELPRLFLLYGLIGMAIGFLVLQYGAVIGFVVFGIGGLLRFRSVIRNSTNTVEVILVTLLGLCVGLNLQHIAILIGVSAWLEGLTAMLADLQQLMGKRDWELSHQKLFGEHSNSTSAQAAATVIFSTAGTVSEVEKELSSCLHAEDVEWRLK